MAHAAGEHGHGQEYRHGQGDGLDAEIARRRAALVREPPYTAAGAGHAAGLGSALLARFRRGHDPVDLDEAVQHLRAAVAATPRAEDAAVPRLVLLCEALERAARRTGSAAPLTEAVQLLDDALDARPAHHPDRAVLLLKGTQALIDRYAFESRPDVLDLAITRGRAAAAAATADDPVNEGAARGILGSALHDRYQRTHRTADLDEAVTLLERAAALATGGNRATATAELARCLLTRARTTRHTGDVDHAARVLRAALDRPPAGGWSRSAAHLLLAELGKAMVRRHERTGGNEALEAARQVTQAALDLLPAQHPGRPAAVANLGSVLERAHRETGDPAPLEQAVGLYRHALAQLPDAGPPRRYFLDGLGYGLRTLYDAYGDPADLHESIGLLRQAAAAFPEDDPDQMATRYSLVQALRAEHQRTGDRSALREAAGVAAAAVAVRTASVGRRIEALAAQGHVRAGLKDWPGAADSLRQAVALVPRLATRDRLLMDQLHDLGDTSGLPSAAAACALNARRPERALELLEHGRGVVLSRRLTARGGLAPLWQADPELAREYVRLRRAFDPPQPAARPDLATPPGRTQPAPAGAPSGPGAPRPEDREAEWGALLRRIRALPGLAGFLVPATAAELLADAGPDPVVLVVPSWYRCDALLLRNGRLDVLRLPRLTFRAAVDRAAVLQEATEAAHDPAVGVRERLAAQQTVAGVLDWLWHTTVHPVLKRLRLDAAPAPGTARPRLWWCPTGPMALLPLHAAAPAEDGGRRWLRAPRSDGGALDRVVSSYTPSVEALRRVRSRPPADPATASSCVVAMGRTGDGHAPLPSAAAEAALAAAALPAATVAADDAARRDRVIGLLAHATHAHFACHAVDDPGRPAESRLLTAGHRERPLTVADISALGLEHAELAFLSACSTARGAARLADESVHITGAFLLAGFRHVVGTLWQVDDTASLEITRLFYEGTRSSRPVGAGPTGAGPTGAGAAPYALHEAVRALRDRYPRTPTLWAAHTHTGA
ncbi:CHAT domain-containing protein [Streptomyces sp. NPDC090445]|uniref:CHAT domain-containing protein n=1 Tax=Streptomyces sp. NPDC090445 TaxID=3365963 RepID=UPI0037F13ECE